MFRRSTTTRSVRPAALALATPAGEGPDADAEGTPSVVGPRHTRRARQRKADDAAALRARLDRVHRRLAEVGSVQVTGHVHAIDNDTARRDPLTRPFAAPFGTPLPGAADEQAPARRSVTAPLPRPA
ncbi:hypothetical protein EV188_10468 [Actinomycetospora succinea]|uniref:Uncharacterized protein n=1 Tax=Actinomycetospora succinea TaxID=663603 RepID=A0A4R6VIM3_9PSEU|nr:hypothetical protein [Actinomycetospora succinea]TDQ58329.1 hypothetical protein EV188_10468 [Actinomycetospora succinea]